MSGAIISSIMASLYAKKKKKLVAEELYFEPLKKFGSLKNSQDAFIFGILRFISFLGLFSHTPLTHSSVVNCQTVHKAS